MYALLETRRKDAIETGFSKKCNQLQRIQQQQKNVEVAPELNMLPKQTADVKTLRKHTPRSAKVVPKTTGSVKDIKTRKGDCTCHIKKASASKRNCSFLLELPRDTNTEKI